MSSNELDNALKFINKALLLKPFSAIYLNKKGIIYSQKGNYPESIKCYSKIINSGRTNDSVYFNRGICFAKIGLYDSSIADLDKAIAISKPNKLYYYNRAFVYMFKKDRENACKDLNTSKNIGLLEIDNELEDYCNGN